MKKSIFIVTFSPLLFAIGCAVAPDDSQESTSEAAQSSSTNDSASDPTIPPREPIIAPGWACADVNCFYRTTVAQGDDCPQNYVCMYQDSNRRGVAWAVFTGHTANFDDLLFNFNDKASSWLNHSGRQYCWYYDRDFKGVFHRMGNGDGINMSTADNDKASSLRPC